MCKHCWDDTESVHHKDFIRGWSDDGFDETPHKKKSKGKPKKKRGCPENNYKEHVYVWVPAPRIYDWLDGVDDDFFKRRGFYRSEVEVCCGCGNRRRSRYTEEFQKLINEKGWYRATYG